MAISDLIRNFEGSINLPVKIDDIVNYIISNGIQDEIEFIGVDMDADILRGYLHKFTYQRIPYGEPVRAANVYYARGQSSEWINLVLCKELVHLCDGKNAISTKAQVDELVKGLALPRDLDNFLEDPMHVLFDKFVDCVAASILLSKASRDLLLPPFKNGLITAEDIARLAAIPPLYVRVVLNDRWERTYQELLTL